MTAPRTGPAAGSPDDPDRPLREYEVEELAAAAAAGSLDALGLLYERYADLSYRFIVVRVQDQALAEDIASELWMKVARAIGAYQTAGKGFPAWLLTIASRLIIDHFRKPVRKREMPTADMLALDTAAVGDSPEEAALRSETAAAVAGALEKLPARQRECLVLRFFVGLSIAETAQAMNRTEGSVKVLQHRSLRKLATVLPPGVGGANRTKDRDVPSVRRTSQLPGAGGEDK
ncbi:RNA polymerase sigma factor [Tenggerimyces flavus]|nr:sigma-70 family RNA polymerase sigma factor [Tenggerimyces flavus]MBM7784827.1 RNA polymerase sigma-70 factor (ECF subfamily) [Tenggerimyces flavus]